MLSTRKILLYPNIHTEKDCEFLLVHSFFYLPLYIRLSNHHSSTSIVTNINGVFKVLFNGSIPLSEEHHV